MSETFVSIITASYNYEKYIRETIESVINQKYTNWELIIVDDGSSDNSIEVIKEYCLKDSRIKLYTHKNNINKGLAKTLQLGLSKASSEWIAFLEADDFITPNYIEKKLEVIERHPDVKFIFNNVNFFGDEEIIQKFKPYIEGINDFKNKTYHCTFPKRLDIGNCVASFSCVMLKKECLKDIDFNFCYKFALDYYLWYQIGSLYKFYFIPDKLTNFRIYKNSYSELTFEENQENKIKQAIAKKVLLNILSFKKKRVIIAFKLIFPVISNFRRSILRIHFKDRVIYFLGKKYQY